MTEAATAPQPTPSPLTLHGIPVYVSGMPGHLTNTVQTSSLPWLRLCWRIGSWRVSTVGGWSDGCSGYAPIGPFRWSETIVVRVVDEPGEPEGRVRSHGEVASVAADDSRSTRAAEALHYRVAEAVALVVAEGRGRDFLAVMDAVNGVPRS